MSNDWYATKNPWECWARHDAENKIYVEVYFDAWSSEFSFVTYRSKHPKYAVKMLYSNKKFPTRHPLETIFIKTNSLLFDDVESAKIAVDVFLTKISKIKLFL